METIKRLIGGIFNFLQGIVVILAVLVMVYLFIMSPEEVNGASMEPNFHNAEYILTNKVAYKFGAPKRGDVIIFKSWRNKDVDYIKRIIALPGETVELKNNSIYVNDQKVEEPYLAPDVVIFGGSFLQEGQPVVIPTGMYFALGDNRPHSSDSREYGPVAFEDIIGVVILRYWPFSQLGAIRSPSYDIR